MSVILKPSEGRFTHANIAEAKELAGKALKFEMENRMGEECEFSTMKFFVFGKNGRCYPVWGSILGKPHEHPTLDGQDQLALIVKIIVSATESRVVLSIIEAWTAQRCHKCGEEYQGQYGESAWKCECGEPRCQPCDNPHRIELLAATLIIFKEYSKHGTNDGYVWTYCIERDEQNRISKFVPQAEGEQHSLGGRFCELWTLREYEVPHFVANFAVFCDGLGVECSDDRRAAAKAVVEAAPPNYKILNWGMSTDIKEALEAIRMQQIIDAAPTN